MIATPQTKRKRRYSYPPERQLYMRQRYLPIQLEAARKKVAMLENEARRYGFTDLLRDTTNG